MICVTVCCSTGSIQHGPIRDVTVKALRLHTCVYICKQHLIEWVICIFLWFIPHSLSARFPLFLPPTPSPEKYLRVGPRPQGSCRDWISNQHCTSCVLASAIFNTWGETVPRGKGKSSACVGRSVRDIITGMQKGKDLTRRRWMKAEVSAAISKLLDAHMEGR